MLFSIIIVNYNLSLEVINCINSIIKSADYNIEIIIVDNNSTDKDSKIMESKILPPNNIKISFYYLDKNLGFGAGNNFGAKKANGEIIYLLNPDTIINNNIFIAVKSLFENNSDIAIVGTKIVNEYNIQEKSVGRFPNLFLEILNVLWLSRIYEKFIFNKKIKLRKDKVLTVDWVTGSSIFIRKTFYNLVDGFDENIFMYSEEIDLCKRIKKIGGEIVYFPEAEIIHKGSLGSKKDYYFFTKTSYESKIYYINKHFYGFEKKMMWFFLSLHIIVQFFVWLFLLPLYLKKSSAKLKAFPKLFLKIFTVKGTNENMH